MRTGRPPLGPALVDHLDGGRHETLQLKTILETLDGKLTIEQACRRLSIGPTRFHVIRRKALAAALDALRPGKPGRPPSSARDPVDPERLGVLEDENAQLRLEVEAHRVRGMLDRMGAAERADREKKKRSRRR